MKFGATQTHVWKNISIFHASLVWSLDIVAKDAAHVTGGHDASSNTCLIKSLRICVHFGET